MLNQTYILLPSQEIKNKLGSISFEIFGEQTGELGLRFGGPEGETVEVLSKLDVEDLTLYVYELLGKINSDFEFSINDIAHILVEEGLDFRRRDPYKPFDIQHISFKTNEEVRITIVTIPLRQIEIDINIADNLPITLEIDGSFKPEVTEEIYNILRAWLTNPIADDVGVIECTKEALRHLGFEAIEYQDRYVSDLPRNSTLN